MSTSKEELLFLIGSRLRNEREKTGMSQNEIAEIFGVSTKTWGKYERGVTMPDAATLSMLGSQLSIDVSYVLTGQRTIRPDVAIAESEEEKKLLENYRAMDAAARLNIQAVGDAFAQSKPNTKVSDE